MKPAKPPIVTCDRPSCDRRFRAELVEVDDVGGGVIQQFTCPRCKYVYRVARFTPRGVELRRRVQAAIAAGDEQLRRDLVEQLQAEVTRLTPRAGG